MRSRGKIPYALLFGLLLACAGMLYAQRSSDRSLFVNGKPAGTVVQFGGHSYIDLETVAQITNGTVTIEPNRVLLNIPELETGPAPEAQPSAAAPASAAGIVPGIRPHCNCGIGGDEGMEGSRRHDPDIRRARGGDLAAGLP